MNISRQDYQEWKHHPVSKVYFEYLRKKRDFIKSSALEQWVAGSDQFASCNQTVRGQIIELDEVVELPFEAIEEFFKEEEVNATEDSFHQEGGVHPGSVEREK